MKALTRDLQDDMEQLPPPEGDLRDTMSNRDDHGRFLPEYNQGTSKNDERVAPKFRSVEVRRKEKDLPTMRTANSSFDAGLQDDIADTVSGARPGGPDGQTTLSSLNVMLAWLIEAYARVAAMKKQSDQPVERVQTARTAIQVAVDQKEKLSQKREILTVDVELDQTMTAFKLTFLNLCTWILANYLGGSKMTLDTLIRSILTLPGERVRTSRTETIRIYRHPRDREAMLLVEAACRLLTSKNLTRDKRRLVYELVDHPAPPPHRSRT